MLRFSARHDGYSLGGELFLPDGPAKACAVIAGAMAVRSAFYAPFARHLAKEGVAALTFDYRGIGASKPDGSLRGFEAYFHQWGENDIGGAIDYLCSRVPGVPLRYVGHSAGAQLMGLAADRRVTRALFVASGTAYWRAYHGRARALMLALWYGIIPATSLVLGYLPMRRLRQGDDVPAGVAREWAKWGKHPRYVASHRNDGFASYDGPLRMLAFADDVYAPPEAVDSLLSLYTGAKKEVLLREGPVGHFGFFRKGELWPEQSEWLARP